MVSWGFRAAASASLVLLALAGVAHAAPERDAKLLQALDAVLVEEEAKTLLDPHLDDLKSLNAEVVEKVVLRQWWGLARDIVAKSHLQQVDLSVAVRKAVRTLKDEADELLRTLNPKYGLAQQVAPAFQWAQNDTCVFLTVKYTVRWNAPGALEVTEPSVNMTLNTFNFSGLGKHSNNKYRYFLSLSLFDHILSEKSSWSAASVGKLSVTLRKRWPRKWPRLIANKKTKIGNMHMWMEMQERLDSTLSGMTTVSNSPVTCGLSEKLYCLATDTCKKADACAQCPGKNAAKLEESLCAGMPTEKASLSFRDADMDAGEIGGEVKIYKAKTDFDIENYAVYFGKDDRSKLEGADGAPMEVGVAASIGADTAVKIPNGTPMPEGATHLLVFSRNEFGEYATPGSVLLKDAVLPKGRPASVSFIDEDGDKGEVSGTVTIGRAQNQQHLDEYALHWGKSDKKKIASASFIRDVMKQADKDATHYISASTKIPEGATHILAFAKNEHGDHPVPASVRIVDAVKPCLKVGDADCPKGVAVSADIDPEPKQAQATITVDRASSEEGLTHYSVYWGRRDCKDGGQAGAKNGHIKDLPMGELVYELPANSHVPDGSTHILLFSKGKVGESDTCVSAEFKDLGAPEKAEL
mmetsp:Transcript_67914/g.196625  ORF Transcript_67914/g.196625 Transcript_67914/m.196625 type:complete len:639 (-) Transcript_67914:201-2117(-)